MASSKSAIIDVDVGARREAEAQLQFQEFTPSSSGVAELDVKTYSNDHNLTSSDQESQSEMEPKLLKEKWFCSIHQQNKANIDFSKIDLETVMKCCHDETLTWDIEPVLSEEFTAELHCINVYVGLILDKKKTSSIVEALNRISPIPELTHLKRVAMLKETGLCVLLHLVDCLSPDECVRKLKEKGFDFDGLDPTPFRLGVPAFSPKTRKQYENSLFAWPCNFFINKYLEKVLNGELFDSKDKKLQEHFMSVALHAASFSSKNGGVGVGCVVADPKKNRIVAVGYDLRTCHSLKHAVLVTIDLVARSQGGGKWPVENGMWFMQPTMERYKGCKRPHDPSDSFSSQYLCTGYDVYVTQEPCPMCAMALIHCRARRIFMGCFNNGALGGKTKLHTVKSLNHHYEVFHGILKDKCAEFCSHIINAVE
ncbi:hypothetical protein J437_LFUL005182 [Ladona fulva]|uniref:CMP/dCMP-type deaminase domain-containing protein n=1 Tax=Ladona fulva TaxID=123851 RepID=A0A8K0KNW5_LADFU|nr:hypothetical protein J437_LFUL005182 [Ladona fulva]